MFVECIPRKDVDKNVLCDRQDEREDKGEFERCRTARADGRKDTRSPSQHSNEVDGKEDEQGCKVTEDGQGECALHEDSREDHKRKGSTFP